jgi:hypothetical protein
VTGPDHYLAAEQHLREAFACTEEQSELSTWNQRQAQVHATLALAAATATGSVILSLPDSSPSARPWIEATGYPRSLAR